MLHIFSLVCFSIYGVNRREVLIAKPWLYIPSRIYAFSFSFAISSFSKSTIFKQNHTFIRKQIL